MVTQAEIKRMAEDDSEFVTELYGQPNIRIGIEADLIDAAQAMFDRHILLKELERIRSNSGGALKVIEEVSGKSAWDLSLLDWLRERLSERPMMSAAEAEAFRDGFNAGRLA